MLRVDTRIRYKDCIMGPARALAGDPCAFGLQDILTVAHSYGGPRHHNVDDIYIRVLLSGWKAQDKVNSRNHDP